MRGHGGDGAAKMSGCHRGVKACIQQVVSKTLYTHRKAHSLNLAIMHASKEPCARNEMTTVKVIEFCLQHSAKMLLQFQEFRSNSDEDRAEMDRRTKLKTLFETQWAARADALFTFKASFGTVVRILED
ncbi:hypothetical protein DPMN_005936 [Dreissena polymorpha]|uniref:Uncharacterized protein n=1 Tax=Dreissena polymorpha TaxID=45954 RepID=A0A9D4MQK3_DREPO|nr:hypothetical protein DPMN_005936 [Dreissena polymorpha]